MMALVALILDLCMKKARALNKMIPALAVVGNKPTSINTISALRIKSFITTFLIIYPFQKACDLNSGGGCSNLGLMYKKGEGVKQDDFKALKFYQKACDLNLGVSCSQLNLNQK
jgi:TPR repeat protein